MTNTKPNNGNSTRPYLLRALHQWCGDNGFTPYITVKVNNQTQVPKEHIVDGEITLNIGMEATGGLEIGNEFISFKARFGGIAREIFVPTEQVIAIFSRENGQGMAFPAPAPAPAPLSDSSATQAHVASESYNPNTNNNQTDKAVKNRPSLKIVK